MHKFLGKCRSLAQGFTPSKYFMVKRFHQTSDVSENVISKNTILGLGNPLLDITATVDASLLDKYSLKANNAILAEERHLPLFEELKRYPVEYIAGGDVLNSIRVAQWLLDTPESTTYFGAVGTDDNSKQLERCTKADRVVAHFDHKPQLPTGVCGVLVTANGFCRSLVANLGAARHYSVEHLRASEQWELVKGAQIFYSSAFFCTVSPESLLELGTHASKNNKTFCHNLAAPFVIEDAEYFQILRDVLKYVDVLFGNDAEAMAFAKSMKWPTQNITEIAQRIAREPKDNACPRTVIITRGTEPTIVVIASRSRIWSVEEYGIIPCDPSELVDTTGAGDSFVGGFLAGLAKGVALVECIAHANYAANTIVKRPGCKLPKQANYKWRGYTLRY
jgi:adenosine kinase